MTRFSDLKIKPNREKAFVGRHIATEKILGQCIKVLKYKIEPHKHKPGAETLIPQLLKVNGRRFLSVEPMLGPISFRWAPWHDYKDPATAVPLSRNGKIVMGRTQYDGVKGIDWVIVGGESGHHKRPFDPEWGRVLRDQCDEAGIPFFFKQIDKVQPIPEDLMIRQFPVNQ